LLTVAAAFQLLTSSVNAADPADLKAQFLADAPKAWRELAAFAENLDGTVVTDTHSAVSPSHYRFEFSHNAACCLYLEQSLRKEDPKEEMIAFNRGYAFILRRKGPDAPWRRTSVEMRSPGVNNWIINNYTYMTKMLKSAVIADGSELIKLAERKTFSIKTITRVKDGDEEFVKVEFSNEHVIDPKANDFDSIQSGSFILDPSHRWCLRRFELKETYSNAQCEVSGVLKVRYTASGHAIPVKRVVKGVSDHATAGKSSYTSTTDFDLKETKDLPPDDRFIMSAYGVPEP
jgi:hypothetical protein